MKKVAIQIVAAVFCVILASCGGGSSPKSVADKALNAWAKVDAKAFVDQFVPKEENLSDKEKKEGLEFIKAWMENSPMKRHEIKSETIDGDKATVNAVWYNPDGKMTEVNIPLVKTGKGWKISSLSW